MLNILKGHINELFNYEQDLYEKRMNICNECPLMSKTKIGRICDRNKCMSNGKLIDRKKKDVNSICGCNCRLDSKLRLPDEECILNKW